MRKSDMSNNHLTGPLPVLSHAGSLDESSVSNSDWRGHLVTSGSADYSPLRVLKLDSNHFEGDIQLTFSMMPNIEVLNLTSNLFGRGGKPIPTQLEHTTKLNYLGLGHNEYDGSIPEEFQVLTQLEEMDLSGNPRVNGTLPEFLGTSLVQL